MRLWRRLLDAPPAIVVAPLPGPSVVGEHDLDDVAQLGHALRVGDGSERLDPAVEISFHQVRRSDEVALTFATAEDIDARVLEVPANDRSDVDRLALAGHARAYRAHAADDEIDRDTRLRRSVQRCDRGRIDKGVALDDDASVAELLVPLPLGVDEVRDSGAQHRRRDHQLAVARLARV